MMKKKLWMMGFALLLLVVGFQGNVFAKTTFKDVPSHHWASKAIQTAIEQKMVEGYPNGTFKPNQRVREDEFLAMLFRAYPQYDIRASRTGEKWYGPYYEFAKEMNYPTYKNDVINRAYVAELIAATQGKNLKGDQAIRYVLDHNLASGKKPGDTSIQSFDGKASLTRAEAVSFVLRALANGNKANNQPILLKRPATSDSWENQPPKDANGKPIPQRDRFKAVEQLTKDIENDMRRLGYDDIKNYSGTVMVRNTSIGERSGVSYEYRGLDFSSFGFFEDFKIYILDFDMKQDKNIRLLVEKVLKEYGLDTKKQGLMEKIISLDTRFEEFEEQGYKISVVQNYSNDGYRAMTIGIDIPTDS